MMWRNFIFNDPGLLRIVLNKTNSRSVKQYTRANIGILGTSTNKPQETVSRLTLTI